MIQESLNYQYLVLLIFVLVKLSCFQLHSSYYVPVKFAGLNFNEAIFEVSQVDFWFHMFLTHQSDC